MDQRFSHVLDGMWLFQVDREERGREESWFAPDFVPEGWLSVPVPGNWDTYLPELFGYAGVAWYRRSFRADPNWRRQRVALRFEGANYGTKVWLNGQELGSHEGGFIPFQFDVTGHLDWQGDNVLAAQVDNWPRLGRIPNSLAGWWNYGGIHRSVSLAITRPVCITDLFVLGEPTDGEGASLSVEMAAYNSSQAPVELEVAACVELEGAEVPLDGELSSGLSLPVEGERRIQLTTGLPSARLWSLESPTLYRLVVTLREAASGELLDQLTASFGVRKFEVHGYQFLLNGEPITLKGINRHEEYYGTGRVDPGGVLEADLRMIKRMGANIVRIHYPCEPRFYELTDRLGLLAFAEIPFWGMGSRDESEFTDPHTVANAKHQIRTMIRNLKNHPSVVIWSVGNECASDTEAGRKTIGEFLDLARELDSSRPVTYVSNRRQRCKCLDLVDFICINQYYGLNLEALGAMLDEVHAMQPGRPILISEFGHEAVRGVRGAVYGSEDQQAEVLQRQWDLFEAKEYLLGAIIWSWADYWHQPMGPEHRWMNRVYFCHGLVDLSRRPKAAFDTVRRMFRQP